MASFVPEVQKTKPKKIRVKKSACKARLGKGHGFKIADCTDDIADKYTLGLAWDVTDGVEIDLDASCIWLDSNLQQIDSVWYENLMSGDASMAHTGDNLTGEGDGDDESLMFDLEKVSPNATYLCFCINSFSGENLSDVASASCRLYNTDTQNELASIDISDNEKLNCTALLMCILYRAGPGSQEWFMQSVCQPAEGQTIEETLIPFQEYLTKHRLADLAQQSAAKKHTMTEVEVPLNPNADNTVAVELESGATESVAIPEGAVAGDILEVPIIDVFSN